VPEGSPIAAACEAAAIATQQSALHSLIRRMVPPDFRSSIRRGKEAAGLHFLRYTRPSYFA
jgi:hypothetical protein